MGIGRRKIESSNFRAPRKIRYHINIMSRSLAVWILNQNRSKSHVYLHPRTMGSDCMTAAQLSSSSLKFPRLLFSPITFLTLLRNLCGGNGSSDSPPPPHPPPPPPPPPPEFPSRAHCPVHTLTTRKPAALGTKKSMTT